MRYDIEQTCISPYPERIRRSVLADRTRHVEAPSAEEAIEHLVSSDSAQLVSEILSFERESVATIRKDELLFLLRLHPTGEG